MTEPHSAGSRRFLRARKVRFLVPVWVVCGGLAFTGGEVLEERLHHLRSGDRREWAEFPPQAEGTELVVPFSIEPGGEGYTLFLRHRDVRQPWAVFVNDRNLGRLPPDENDMISHWSIEPDWLRSRENVLKILPETDRVDDILVGQIRLERGPPRRLLSEARVSVRVTDGDRGERLPSRLTIVDENGSLVPLGVESSSRLAVRTGVIYTADGEADFGLRPGKYTIYAGRGFEYSLDERRISLGPGDEVELHLELRREVPVAGYVSVDTHLHTLTYSGHGDASIEERLIAIAGEGIEVPVATDHNIHVDYDPVARRLELRSGFTPVIGNEVTTRVGHFNIFPAKPGAGPPDHTLTDWPSIFQALGRTPSVEVIVLNHPRDIHAGFRPFGTEHFNPVTGEFHDGRMPEFDALEAVNSGALQTDPMQVYRDWFALLNRGYSVTTVGSSDSHDVSRHFNGQARTYVACSDDGDPGRVDLDAVFRSLKAGRVLVSMGLLAEIEVDDRYGPGDLVPATGPIEVRVRVRGPSWVSAERVSLYANGVRIREERISDSAPGTVKWEGEWTLEPPRHDLYLVAVATGPGVTEPYWPIAKPYQPASLNWRPYVIGSTGAVKVDVDGDGRWSSPYEYAVDLARLCAGDEESLIKELGDYDEAVAVQLAGLLHQQGQGDCWAALYRAALHADSLQHARRAFFRYIDSLREP